MSSMTASSGAALTWQLNGTRAQFCIDGWTGSVDLELPMRGATLSDGAAIRPGDLDVLGIEVAHAPGRPGKLIDAYVRDADLIAVYAEQSAQPLGVQVYWSLARCELLGTSGLQIDLLASIQTQQLDVPARAVSSSRLTAREAWGTADPNWQSPRALSELTEGRSAELLPGREVPCLLAAIGTAAGGDGSTKPNSGCSYAEAMPPSDFVGSKVSVADGRMAVQHRLLDEIMEKGVIRRLRVRGACWRQPPNFALAAAMYHQFLTAQPRLTT